MAIHDFDPEGRRLPIKIDRTSNGEYAPPLLTRSQQLARRLAHEAASENARRARPLASRLPGLRGRRRLDAGGLQRANSDARGGYFAVPEDAARRSGARGGDGRRRRVHLRRPDPLRRAERPLVARRDGQRWADGARAVFGQASKCTSGSFDCYSAQTLAKEVFLDSDTDVAVVSALWGQPNPTPIDYAAESARDRRRDRRRGRARFDPWRRLPARARRDRGDGRDGAALPGRRPGSSIRNMARTGAASSSTAATRRTASSRRHAALGVKTVAVHKGVPLPRPRI